MVDTIYTNVDVQGEAQTLHRGSSLWPAAVALCARCLTGSQRGPARPARAGSVGGINRAMHERLITVVEEDVDEPVTLDLGDIVEGVGAQAGLNIADRLPPDAGQIEVIPADDLSTAPQGRRPAGGRPLADPAGADPVRRRDLPGPRLAPRGAARGRLRLHRRRDRRRRGPRLRRELRRGHACLDGRREAA